MNIPRNLRITRIGTLLFGAAALAACAEPSSTPAGSDATLDGPDRPVRLSTTDVVSVGALEGADWEIFSRVDAVAFDAVGNLYVYDPENHRVVVADPRGNHLRTLGREGDGPGELRSPAAMAVGRDGTVVIADLGSRSLVVYDDAGEFVREVPFEGEHGMPFGNLAMRSTGDLVTRGRGMVINLGAGPDEGPEEPDFVPIRAISPADGTETVLYEAWLPPAPEEQESETLEGGGGQRMMIVSRRVEAFRPGTHAAILPDGGLAVADSVDWSIDLLAPDGTPRGILRRPIAPRTVTDELRDAERERRIAELEERGSRLRMFGSGGGTPSGLAQQVQEMRRRQIDDMAFADQVPVLARVVADWDGHLWVERTGAMPGEDGPIDLVDADGTYYGTLGPGSFEIPSAFGPDGLAAWVETDEFDVQHVVVRRIAWPPDPT
jgi:hypothetical protein